MPDGDPARVASVFGSSRIAPRDPEYADARTLGRLLAAGGWTVCTGGYDGAMAAVSRGAHEAGGHVIGVTLPGAAFRSRPNRWLVEERPAEDLFGRLRMLMVADAWLAVSGGVGTLAEVTLAWNLLQTGGMEPRPLVLVGPRWERMLAMLRRELILGPEDLGLVRHAADPAAALGMIG